MKNIEDMLVQKLYEIINLAVSKIIKPDIKLENVTQLDEEMIAKLKEQGIDYIGFACKLLKKNFIKACEKMNIESEKVLIIGNDIFDDIYGGKRNKMRTALIKEVVDEEESR